MPPAPANSRCGTPLTRPGSAPPSDGDSLRLGVMGSTFAEIRAAHLDGSCLAAGRSVGTLLGPAATAPTPGVLSPSLTPGKSTFHVSAPGGGVKNNTEEDRNRDRQTNKHAHTVRERKGAGNGNGQWQNKRRTAGQLLRRRLPPATSRHCHTPGLRDRLRHSVIVLVLVLVLANADGGGGRVRWQVHRQQRAPRGAVADAQLHRHALDVGQGRALAPGGS